jgi:hypothetical protein
VAAPASINAVEGSEVAHQNQPYIHERPRRAELQTPTILPIFGRTLSKCITCRKERDVSRISALQRKAGRSRLATRPGADRSRMRTRRLSPRRGRRTRAGIWRFASKLTNLVRLPSTPSLAAIWMRAGAEALPVLAVAACRPNLHFTGHAHHVTQMFVNAILFGSRPAQPIRKELPC